MNTTEESIQEDIELVERISNGDLKAEARLYEKFKPLVLFIARKYLRNIKDIEDIVHDVLLKVLEFLRKNKLEKPDKLAAFIIKTSKNKMIDIWKIWTGKDFIGIEDMEEMSQRFEKDDAQQLIKKEEIEQIFKIIDRLPLLPDRVFILLKYTHGLTGEEIGHLFKYSSNAVRKRIERAIQNVRQILI